MVVYRFISDLHFYCTGGDDENEIILASVLSAFFEAVAILLRYVLLYNMIGTSVSNFGTSLAQFSAPLIENPCL